MEISDHPPIIYLVLLREIDVDNDNKRHATRLVLTKPSTTPVGTQVGEWWLSAIPRHLTHLSKVLCSLPERSERRQVGKGLQMTWVPGVKYKRNCGS